MKTSMIQQVFIPALMAASAGFWACPAAAAGATSTRTFDANNQLASVTYSDGRRASFAYDEMGNLLSVGISSVSAPVVIVSQGISGTVGEPISDYPILVNHPSDVTGFSVKGLPAGLKVNTGSTPNADGKAPGVIYGTPTAGGLFKVTLSANSAAAKGTPVVLMVNIDNPFTETIQRFALAGALSGIVEGSSIVGVEGGGAISLTLTSGGSFTGSIQIGTAKQAFIGRFDSLTGMAPAIVINRAGGLAPLSLNLALTLSGSDRGAIVGTLASGGETASVELFRQVYSKSMAPVLFASAKGTIYTVALALQGHEGDQSYPQGTGFLTVKIDAVGKATLAGKLADGTALTASSYVWPDGTLPVYVPLYGGNGSLVGNLMVEAQALPPTDNTLSGSLDWLHPATNGKANLYLNRFEATLNALGGAYTPPAAGYRVLDLGNAANHIPIQIELTDGGLSGPITVPFTLSTKNAAAFALPNTYLLNVSFAAPTGLFVGEFTAPTPPRKAKFFGVLLPASASDPARGYGTFLLPGPTASDPVHSGNIRIGPP